jgi:hypothetical protein
LKHQFQSQLLNQKTKGLSPLSRLISDDKLVFSLYSEKSKQMIMN